MAADMVELDGLMKMKGLRGVRSHWRGSQTVMVSWAWVCCSAGTMMFPWSARNGVVDFGGRWWVRRTNSVAVGDSKMAVKTGEVGRFV